MNWIATTLKLTPLRSNQRAVTPAKAGVHGSLDSRLRGNDVFRGRSRLVFALMCLISLSLAGPAWAHAHLVKSDPPVGGSVAATDTLRLTFSEGIELAFSKVEVAKEDGTDLGATKLAADSADAKVVVVTLPAKLAPGGYKIHWHVVSVDTHHTEGTFAFTVNP